MPCVACALQSPLPLTASFAQVATAGASYLIGLQLGGECHIPLLVAQISFFCHHVLVPRLLPTAAPSDATHCMPAVITLLLPLAQVSVAVNAARSMGEAL